MIFRKPYAFLIRHFRFIHLLITCIMVYLAKFSTEIYQYINVCIEDNVNRYNSIEYIDYNIYIWLFVLLGLFGVIYWLFKYKDKPRNVYVISIFGYIIVGIYLFIIFGYFSSISINIINQKVIRAYRDIMLMTLIFQYILIIIMFLRGLGFDVKKFNFTRDIQDLNVNEEDGEEVLVDMNVSTDAMLRVVRKQKREWGYFFKEYKVIILGIFAIILFTLGYFSYSYIRKEFKVYNQGDIFGYMYSINVNKSYFNMGKDSNYVIVNFDISKYGLEEKFNLNNFKLMIGDEEYIANKNICNSFSELGNCYKKQYITSDVKNYIVTYEVDSLNLEKTYLVYNESYDYTYKIKLNLENYD